jgi:hypothetical protein
MPDRATESNVRGNKESAQTKLKLPVLAVGSRDFIGKEVKKRKEYVAENVERTRLRPPAGRRVFGVTGEDLLGALIGLEDSQSAWSHLVVRLYHFSVRRSKMESSH